MRKVKAAAALCAVAIVAVAAASGAAASGPLKVHGKVAVYATPNNTVTPNNEKAEFSVQVKSASKFNDVEYKRWLNNLRSSTV